MSLVLDASAAVDALLSTRLREPALRAMEGQTLYAPQIIDLEVLSAIARLERAGTLTQAEADRGSADWAGLTVERVDTGLVASSIWELRRSVRISDAFYLATAGAMQRPLLTSDGRLARAPVGGVTIILLS
ncbi:MAG: type II toxin-antitoxin system VapC family toxin [Nocardioidaceae bacterium]